MKRTFRDLSLRAGLGLELAFTIGLLVAARLFFPSQRPPESADFGRFGAAYLALHVALYLGLLVFLVWWSGTPLRHMGLRWRKRGLTPSLGFGLFAGLFARIVNYDVGEAFPAVLIVFILAYFLCRAAELGLGPEARMALVTLMLAASWSARSLPNVLLGGIILAFLAIAFTRWRNLPGLSAAFVLGLFIGQVLPHT